MSEDKKKCTYCGTENKADSRFCINCGQKFGEENFATEENETKIVEEIEDQAKTNEEKYAPEEKQVQSESKTIKSQSNSSNPLNDRQTSTIRKSSFFNFDKMLTPVIIKSVFIFSVVIAVLIGLGLIITGISNPYAEGLPIIGVLVIIFVPLLIRIYSELAIILFKIHETLEEIRQRL